MSAKIRVYRVQAADGRGPWRPGWSHTWIDGDAPADRLTETVMDLMPIAQIRALPSNMMYGSACRSLNALFQWFTALECERLRGYGYFPVQVDVDVVLAESPWQMLVGRRRAFADGATRLSWPRNGNQNRAR